MTVPRAEARAVRLRTGDVLFVGGTAITKVNPVLTAELYYPAPGIFTPVGTSHLRDATQIENDLHVGIKAQINLRRDREI
jgi:hypothetical protein